MHKETFNKTLIQIVNEIYNPLKDGNNCSYFSINNEDIEFRIEHPNYAPIQNISIYKFMSLSKILASAKGYDIFSRPKINRTNDFKYALAIVSFGEEEKHCAFRINPLATFTADTEFEAVITAMYFVLNEDEEEE